MLSLAHFTVMDADPLGLVEAGAAGGFDAVGLRIVPPFPTDRIVEVVGNPALQRDFRRRLDDRGLALLDVEAFWLHPETTVAALRPALDVAAALGARHVLTVGNDPDRGRMAARFAEFCAEAASRGLRVMLEFIPYSRVRTLAETVAFLAETEPADAGVLVDALHLSRSGGDPAELAAHDPALFSYAHLCDAPAAIPPAREIRPEARGGRLYPGEGGLPLRDFVAAFPPGTPMAVEAPCLARAGLSPTERARLAGSASRALLREFDGDRHH